MPLRTVGKQSLSNSLVLVVTQLVRFAQMLAVAQAFVETEKGTVFALNSRCSILR